MKLLRISHFFAVLALALLASMPACISFRQADLGSILFQPGDLPAQLTPGSGDAIPENETLDFDTAYRQTFETEAGQTVGEVRVYLFHSQKDRDRAFDLFSLMESQEGIIPYDIPSIGEVALARQDTTGAGDPIVSLAFERCYAVADVWFQTDGEVPLGGQDILSYAQELDTRLQQIACR